MKKVGLIIILLFTIYLTGCRKNPEPVVEDPDPLITITDQKLLINETAKLSVTNYNSLDLFEITCTPKEIISISSDYTITALERGVCTINIFLKTNPSKQASLTINCQYPEAVNPLPILSLRKDYIMVGGRTYLSVDNYPSLDLFDITIDNEEIADIDEWYRLEGKTIGKVIITATLKAEKYCIGNIEFEVISPAPALYVSKDKLLVNEIGYYNIQNFDCLVENSLNDFDWVIEDETILRLNDDNSFTTLAPGSTKLIATSKTDKRITNYYDISVVNDQNEVIINTSNLYQGSINAGDQIQLTINSPFDPSSFAWSTTDKEILRVNEKGLVTTLKAGFASVVIYEIGNPRNNASFSFNVTGTPNVDYVSRILTIALGEKGYVERQNEAGEYVNDTKYNHWYNMDGAWCAMFVSWNWYQAGLSNTLLLKYASVSLGKEWCVANNIFKYKENYNPKSGDIIFFLSSGSSHTGIVVYADDTYVYTIEGNASNRVDVWRWNINDARITGYGVPNYPPYQGTPADFSWIATALENDGTYWWNNVPLRQETE